MIQHAGPTAKFWNQISPNIAPSSNETIHLSSSCSDQSAEYNPPLRGLFWSSSNFRSQSSSVSATTTVKRFQSYWDRSEISKATYHTAQQQEHLFDPPEYPEAPSLTIKKAEYISKTPHALFSDFSYNIFSFAQHTS